MNGKIYVDINVSNPWLVSEHQVADDVVSMKIHEQAEGMLARVDRLFEDVSTIKRSVLSMLE